MGLGNGVNDEQLFVEDGEDVVGGGGGYDKSFSGSTVSCSICLEVVTDNGDRSRATLQCGHQFHLDCIGSAFNIKGAMQCPNCRKIEKGQWLYANGCRPVPELNMDDWANDEDLSDLSYSEMSFGVGVHWCPYSSMARIHPSYEEGDFPPNAYHEIVGQHAFLAEHAAAAVASASPPCPYVFYGPVHNPSSSSSSGSVSYGSSFNSYWSGPSMPSELPSSYAFPTTDLRYHSWEHHSPPYSSTNSRMAPADQPSVPSTQRSARSSSDPPRLASFVHPFLAGHSSGARASSSVASSISQPYQGSNARTRDRVQALQAYYQQQPGGSPPTPMTPGTGTRRSSSHRGTSQTGTLTSLTDQSGFYYVPAGASGRSFQEPESTTQSRFRGARERDHPPSFPLNQADRDAAPVAFHRAAGGTDPDIRSSSLRQWHGSERMLPSQNRS